MSYRSGGDEVLSSRSGRLFGAGSVATELEARWLHPATDLLRDLSRSRITSAILALGKRGNNWDAYGSAAADVDSINQAIDAVETFIRETAEIGLTWLDPFVGLNEDGHVTFEWWNGVRKLTIYMIPGDPEFLSSWGTNMETQMCSGKLTDGEFAKLWRWLQTPV